MAYDGSQLKVGVIGSGFIARHFVQELARRPEYRLSKVLTRRPLTHLANFPSRDSLVNNLDEVIENSDIVLECTGDTEYAGSTIGTILDAGKPVVTLNCEFHSTIGSYFVNRGLLSEADGDQPGCLASLHEDAVQTGFEPLACVNMKAFLNHNPKREDMIYWADRQKISLEMVTSFTDGTKVQLEQCLVANGLGMDIAKEGLTGVPTADVNAACTTIGEIADRHGKPIIDYILERTVPHGVLVVARHNGGQEIALRNYKLGSGPYYLLLQSYCLGHLEVFKTIQRLMQTGSPLLNNSSNPTISVASIAKREIAVGETIDRGYGSFDLRGECVRIADRPDHLPICLANKLRFRRRVEPGQFLTIDDVEFTESPGILAWTSIRDRVVATAKRHAPIINPLAASTSPHHDAPVVPEIPSEPYQAARQGKSLHQ